MKKLLFYIVLLGISGLYSCTTDKSNYVDSSKRDITIAIDDITLEVFNKKTTLPEDVRGLLKTDNYTFKASHQQGSKVLTNEVLDDLLSDTEVIEDVRGILDVEVYATNLAYRQSSNAIAYKEMRYSTYDGNYTSAYKKYTLLDKISVDEESTTGNMELKNTKFSYVEFISANGDDIKSVLFSYYSNSNYSANLFDLSTSENSYYAFFNAEASNTIPRKTVYFKIEYNRTQAPTYKTYSLIMEPNKMYRVSVNVLGAKRDVSITMTKKDGFEGSFEEIEITN